MYMPGGLQTITPCEGGIGQPITVLVDRSSAEEIETQRSALLSRHKRPYFDFNHTDGEASFWPESFYWKESPAPGIYCRGRWSEHGRRSVEGWEWRQFSPVFYVDNKRGKPARIVARPGAKPNMGGLVNDPAFHSILPLWSREGPETTPALILHPSYHSMNEPQLAALQARNQELETELQTLKTKNDEQSRSLADRQRADAESAVKRAVARHAIPARDLRTQEALVAKAAEDPSFINAIDAMQGQVLQGRLTPGASSVQILHEAPNATMKAFAAILARNAAIPLSPETHKAKGVLAREAAALFARDIEKDELLTSMPIEDAIKAADNTDVSVGLLSGTLVLQRALPLMQYEYPILNAVTTDFSDAPGLLNQTEKTRLILKPAVQTYDTSTDGAGRPKGWSTVSPAQMVDIPITLDEYVGVPVVFGNHTLASTVRNLFAEQAPQALYALGGYLVNKLASLFTATNYNAYKGTTATGGATTNGSASIVVASTANMYPGQAISGTGIPANTYVAHVTDSTHAELTRAATATNTGLTLTLSDSKVPATYATYVKAAEDFDMSSLSEIGCAFDNNEVPQQNRFALLNAAYHSRLAQDPSFNTYFAAMHKPEVITKGVLPELQGFTPIKAPYFPSSGNRVGFAGHKAAALIKTRLPQDFSSAVGAMVPGSVTTVTAPGGLSVLLVQYVSLRENYAEWRPEVMLGAAVGERRCGLVLTAA